MSPHDVPRRAVSHSSDDGYGGCPLVLTESFVADTFFLLPGPCIVTSVVVMCTSARCHVVAQHSFSLRFVKGWYDGCGPVSFSSVSLCPWTGDFAAVRKLSLLGMGVGMC